MLGRKGLAGVQQFQCSRPPHFLWSCAPAVSRMPARAIQTDTAFQASEQPQQSGSTIRRQQLQQHLADLERVLPSLSCSQLANTLSSLALTYQAANLSCEAGTGLSNSGQLAGSAAAADPHAIVDFYNESFPDQSFLLTFRNTVGEYLAQHPASFTFAAAAAAAADADAADSEQSQVACSACNPAHLAKILASVASLPIMVVQPLPIGEPAAALGSQIFSISSNSGIAPAIGLAAAAMCEPAHHGHSAAVVRWGYSSHLQAA